MKYFTCLAILITCNPVSAQKTRQGWKIVTDQNKSCQYAVPRDWAQDTVRAGVSNSPDNKVTVVALTIDNGRSFEEIEKNARTKMPPLKIIANSGKRDWYIYRDVADGDDSPDAHWYVAVRGNKYVCTAQITFKSAMGESLVRQIVGTVEPVK